LRLSEHLFRFVLTSGWLGNIYNWGEKLISDFWTIFKHEILSYCRDKIVLLQIIALPFLYMPAGLCILAIVWLCCQGSGEHCRHPVAVTGRDAKAEMLTLASDLVTKERQTELVSLQSPEQALKAGRLDAILNVQGNSSIEISIDGTRASSMATGSILSDVLQARGKAQTEALLKSCGLNFDWLSPFSIDCKGIQKKEENEGDLFVPLFVYGLLIILTLIASMFSFYPIMCSISEELEKSTLETTLLLPVSRFKLLGAKFCAVYTVTLASTVFNVAAYCLEVILIGLIVAIALVHNAHLLLRTLLEHLCMAAGPTLFNFLTHGPVEHALRFFTFLFWEAASPQNMRIVAHVFIMIMMFALNIAVMVSVGLALTCTAHSFKEAQNRLTYPLAFCGIIPLAVVLPQARLDFFTALVPVLNLAMLWRGAIERTLQPATAAIALVETLLLIILALGYTVGRLDREQLTSKR
jgi:sodium transport system permease protein